MFSVGAQFYLCQCWLLLSATQIENLNEITARIWMGEVYIGKSGGRNIHIYNTDTLSVNLCQFFSILLVTCFFTVSIANMEGCRGARLHHVVQKLALYIC